MIFLDANAILYYLHDVKPFSQTVEDVTSEEDELYTSLRIVDEAIFTIVRTKAWIKLGIRRIEKLRDHIQKHGYEFFEEDIEKTIQIPKRDKHNCNRKQSHTARTYRGSQTIPLIASRCTNSFNMQALRHKQYPNI